MPSTPLPPRDQSRLLPYGQGPAVPSVGANALRALIRVLAQQAARNAFAAAGAAALQSEKATNPDTVVNGNSDG